MNIIIVLLLTTVFLISIFLIYITIEKKKADNSSSSTSKPITTPIRNPTTTPLQNPTTTTPLTTPLQNTICSTLFEKMKNSNYDILNNTDSSLSMLVFITSPNMSISKISDSINNYPMDNLPSALQDPNNIIYSSNNSSQFPYNIYYFNINTIPNNFVVWHYNIDESLLNIDCYSELQDSNLAIYISSNTIIPNIFSIENEIKICDNKDFIFYANKHNNLLNYVFCGDYDYFNNNLL